VGDIIKRPKIFIGSKNRNDGARVGEKNQDGLYAQGGGMKSSQKQGA